MKHLKERCEMNEVESLQKALTEFLMTHEIKDVLTTLNKTIVACGDPDGIRIEDIKHLVSCSHCNDCGSDDVEIGR
jgi:hypothetical protein